MEEKLTYKQALEELQKLVDSIEDPKRDLTRTASRRVKTT